MTFYESMRIIKEKHGYNAKRIYAELYFAYEYNHAYNCGFEEILTEKAELACSAQYISDKEVLDVEESLKALSDKIKTLRVIAVSHAHIDMNWMWSFDETVNVTLSTFRTILDLMNEYPDFTFSQSQASVYKIVEEYDPDMLDEIRQRVKQGRWELNVTSWVETDKNMPGGETLCRHILYAKKYISKLFDVPEDSLQLDFEPDTFGHNANVPQILSCGGVKYYYHCRGYKGHHIYLWQSGKDEILCYREPMWYNASIEAEDFAYMPAFAKNNGINTLLKVYGVGDHGGGPTRRDLSKLIDMSTWPLLPKIEFGTYREFYDYLDSLREQFPVVTGELNAAFTGCYTTQARIKKYNKICEAQLYEAEMFDSLSLMHGCEKIRGAAFEKAWESVMFNDFHDILPGSGVVDTREYALGKYQQCLAVTSSRKMKALGAIACKIDTSNLNFPKDDSCVSFGAGVGYCHTQNLYGFPDRNNTGENRIYHLFNSTASDYLMPSVITVWDYPGQMDDISLSVLSKEISYQILDKEPVLYWDHHYQRIAVDAVIPAFGYTTVVIEKKKNGELIFDFPSDPRLSEPHEFILENDILSVELDTVDCSVVKIFDKRSKKTIIDNKTAFFRFVQEDASEEMTAWRVGRYRSIENLTSNITVKPCDYVKGELIQSLTYSLDFSNSHLTVTVSLAKGCPYLKFNCKCDFGERPILHESVPMLNVFFPAELVGDSYVADIPFGKIKREFKNMDMPTLSGVNVESKNGKLFVISGSKYGFRTTAQGVSLTLIRGSYDPDPTPDYGMNEFDFALGTAKDFDEYDKITQQYNHQSISLSAVKCGGTLPQRGELIKVEGAKLAALKMSQDGKGYILRLFDCKEKAKVILPFNATQARLSDINENMLSQLKTENNVITLPKLKGIVTVYVS